MTQVLRFQAPVKAFGEHERFGPRDRVRVSKRYPIGHYHIIRYIRGKMAIAESIIQPVGIDDEQEGFRRDTGEKLHYYRIAIPLSDLWLRRIRRDTGDTGVGHEIITDSQQGWTEENFRRVFLQPYDDKWAGSDRSFSLVKAVEEGICISQRPERLE